MGGRRYIIRVMCVCAEETWNVTHGILKQQPPPPPPPPTHSAPYTVDIHHHEQSFISGTYLLVLYYIESDIAYDIFRYAPC